MLDEEKGQTQLPCKQKPLPDRDVVSAGATGAIAPIDFKKSPVQLVQLYPSIATVNCDQAFSRSLSMDFMKIEWDTCTRESKFVTTSLLEK